MCVVGTSRRKDIATPGVTAVAIRLLGMLMTETEYLSGGKKGGCEIALSE